MSAVTRRAASLPELLVALVLAGIAGTLGAGLLSVAERRLRASAASDVAAQLARDVAHLLGPEIAAAWWPGVEVRGDTALELDSHVGVSVACVVAPLAVVLPSAATDVGDPYTAWRQPIEPGDALAARDTGGVWHSRTVVAVVERGDGAGCPADGVLRTAADSALRRPVYSLSLAGSFPPGVLPGAPVRVRRRVRWALYRAADSRWWLGYRRCTPACGPAQPVAGPFASPRDTGLAYSIAADAVLTVAFRPASGGGLAPLAVRHWAVRGASPR